MSTHVQVQCTQVQATPDPTVDVVTRTVLREELQQFVTESFKRDLITAISDRVVDVVRQQLQMVCPQPSNLRQTASVNTNGMAPEVKNWGSLQWPMLMNLMPPRQMQHLHTDEPPGVGRSSSRESKDDPWSFEIRRHSVKKPARPSLSEDSLCTDEDFEEPPAMTRQASANGSGGNGGEVTKQLSANKPWVPGCPGKPQQEDATPWRFEIRKSTSAKPKAEDEHSDSDKPKEERDSTKVGRCSSVALKPVKSGPEHTTESNSSRSVQTKEGAAPVEKKEEAAARQETTESFTPKTSRSGNLREFVLQPQENTQDEVSSLHSCAVASFSVCSSSNKPQLHRDPTMTDGTRSQTSFTSRRPVEEETSGVGFAHHAQNWVVKEEMQLIQHGGAGNAFGENGSERSSLSGFFLPRWIELTRMKKSIKRFVRSPQLDYMSTVLILLNSVVLGIQTDMAAVALDEGDHIAFKVTEYTFGFCFLVELVLKISVHKSNFFCKPGCSWNYFDCLVVGIQVVEVLMSVVAHFLQADFGSGESSGSGMMRILRILRLVRVLRMVRIMHLVSELRTIIVAISSSMRSLGWTMLLLLLLVYLIGVYLTQLVTTARKNEDCTGPCYDQLTQHFGSLARTLLVLYQIITGGIDWSEVTEPLMEHISVLLAILFSFYIAFVVFALMNVVTGVFVEAALKSTKHDQDVVLLHHIRHLLKVIDADHSGTISWEEFESQLYSPDMVRLFKTIDLDPEEARDLFRLIDIDGSGEISSDEFINGCLRLRGPAKAIDMAAFMFDYKRTSTALKEHSRLVEETLAWIAQGGLHQLAAFQTPVAPSAQTTTYRIKMSL